MITTQSNPDQSPAPTTSRQLTFRRVAARAGLVIVLVAVAAWISSNENDSPGESTNSSSADTKLEQAFENAISTGSNFVDISPDGKSLSFHTEGAETTGLSLDKAVGILIYLDAPDSLFARMDNTRALDGTQTATWGDITAYWTYHPDDGLSVVLEER